jgi:hypothetical protein
MIVNNLFLKIYQFFTVKNIRADKEEPDVTKWHKFIKSIPEPKDDIERTFCRYLCRMEYFSPAYRFFANLVALFFLLFNIPVFFRKPNNGKSKYLNYDSNRVLIVKVNKIRELDVPYNDILPPDLNKNKHLVEVEEPVWKDWFLTENARSIIIESFKRRPYAFFLNYWIFRELCFCSYFLYSYKPGSIAVYVKERNVAAPMLSNICEKEGVDYVSFMHGEYPLHLIQGFMRFTRYYVWDEHYVKMFVDDLRCEKSQFRVYTPDKYKKLVSIDFNVPNYDYYATYYLNGDEDKRIIIMIAKVFKIFKDNNIVCKIRPHPRATNMKVVNEILSDFFIEDPYSTTVFDSIRNSRYIIALNSTVLTEAFHAGKEIVIDDFSDKNKYNNMMARKYHILHKNPLLLSAMISSFE